MKSAGAAKGLQGRLAFLIKVAAGFTPVNLSAALCRDEARLRPDGGSVA